MKKEILKNLFKKKEEEDRTIHPAKFKNFDNFLLAELVDYLNYIRAFMNSDSVTAEFMAKTDSMLLGFNHGLQMAESQTVSCRCCKYWCAGANCPIVKEAWDFFIEEIPSFKVLFIKTEL